MRGVQRDRTQDTADSKLQQHPFPLQKIVGFLWVWSAVARRKGILWLLARFRDFERPEHATRSPVGTHTCTVVYRRVPCVPRSRERETRPAAGREKFCIPEKRLYTQYYKSPLRPFRVVGWSPRGDASWHATGKMINRHTVVVVV